MVVADQLESTRASSWNVHRLFGLTLLSDYPFANQLAQASGTPDLTFSCVPAAPQCTDWTKTTPAYASPYRMIDGESILYLHRAANYDVLHFTRVADFYLWTDRIVCHLLDPAHDYMVEIRLLGPVLSFWLELQGIPTLHASAISIEQQAVAFLSSNRGGKSSLAATLMESGFPLLTDDILPIERRQGTFMGRPGYPQMRLWPEEAEYFLGHYRNLARVHIELSKRRVPVGQGGYGTFCDTSQPLSCMYLPERHSQTLRGKGIEIIPVSPRDTSMQLLRHSFAARIIEAAGKQAQRLSFFAQMGRQVPLRRIIYPSGFNHLPRVRDAILKDLDSLKAAG